MWSTSTSGFSTCKHHRGGTPVLGNSNSRNDVNAGDATQSKSSKAVCSALPDTSPATVGPGRTALPTVSAAQPADRLKQLAARSRTDKLRAAAQQLKATSPVDAAAVREVQPVAAPAAAPAVPDTWGAPAVPSASSTDCDLEELLDDISLELEPPSLLAKSGALYTSLHKPGAPTRAASQPVCSQARRVLADAVGDEVAGGCQPSALGVSSRLENPSLVRAAVQAGDELGICSSSSPSQVAAKVEGSPTSTGTVDTVPYAQPQQQPPSDLLAATSAMQRRLERLQRSLSSLGSGATSSPPSSSACCATTAPDLVKDDSPISRARVPLSAAERDPLAGMHPTGVAGQQAQARRVTSAAMVVTRAPPPAVPVAGAPGESRVSAADHAQHRPDYISRRLDFLQHSRATLGQTSRASTAACAIQQPWESLSLRQHNSLARPQAPVSSMSMLAHRPYSAASSLAATSSDILEAWRARRRAEQQQQADASSPASSTGSTAGQRPLSRFLDITAPRDLPAVPFCPSSQQHVPPLERLGHIPRSSYLNSSSRLSSVHPTTSAQPAPTSPERRYSRYMSLVDSTAGSGGVAPPRPVSTPPTAAGVFGSTAYAQPGSAAVAADLLSRRSQSAEPASCTPSASRSGMQDDILERWRARRRQLQHGRSDFSAAGSGGGNSGYDYASLLLLRPAASCAQGNSEVPGSPALMGPSTSGAAGGVQSSVAAPRPDQATATAAAPQPAVPSADGLDSAGARLARLSAVLQQHGAPSPALALPAPAATEGQQLLTLPSQSCAAAQQKDLSLESEEQQGTDEAQLACSVSGPRREAQQQLLLLPPSRDSSCSASRCSSGQATPRSSCPTDGRHSSMWSPSMNLLVDDLIGTTLFDAPLAPEPSSGAGAEEGSGPEMKG